MKHLLKLKLLFILSLFGFSVFAQESKFDKYEAFSPLFLNELTNSFHSATGKPGPNYWQNQVDYHITAELDTLQHSLKGEVTLTYKNNSPYDLSYIWLQLDQNAFTEDSRSKALYPANDRNGIRTPTDGYQIKSVQINKKPAKYLVNDTRMQVRFDDPLKANGNKTSVKIAYEFKLPTHGKDRMGHVETKNGWIYTLAQWFPRMAVYDEVEGWNTIPYLGTGEFYLEYGNYEYEITAPENMIVVGSGELQNPKEVLTKTLQKRLEKAKNSDETVMIVSKEEMQKNDYYKKGKNGKLTWKFKMNNSRDVAWAASKAFIWDAAKINLPNGKTALAQSVYPEENSGMDGYARSTEYTKHAIEIYSKDWFVYPYKVATNVGAHEGGMEYPGIVFCSYKSKESDLWGVINHEFGHIWFPMIVGSNERVYGWLDEGLNTFINDLATQQFNKGEYYDEQNLQEMGAFMFNERWDPLFTRADVIHSQQKLGVEAYYKPATALHVLRNSVLGKDRFDYALRQYIQEWQYKHPQPWDFFNTMSNAAGEDLGWFFKGWFMKNWSNDQSVQKVEYNDDDYSKGAQITIANLGEMPMPVSLEITFEDQSKKNAKLPVEIWMTGSEYVYHLDSNKKIISVEIDPEHQVPDENTANNFYKKLKNAPEDVTAESVLNQYIEAVGGRSKLESVKDLSLEMQTKIQGSEVSITDQFKNPDKYRRSLIIYGQKLMDITVNGDKVELSAQGNQQELAQPDQDYLKTYTREHFRELDVLDKDYPAHLKGIDVIEGQEVYVVEFSTPNEIVYTNYYKVDSGLKVQGADSKGMVKKFDNYKMVDGIQFPFTIKETLFGFGQEVNLEVKEIKVNSNLSDDQF